MFVKISGPLVFHLLLFFQPLDTAGLLLLSLVFEHDAPFCTSEGLDDNLKAAQLHRFLTTIDASPGLELCHLR